MRMIALSALAACAPVLAQPFVEFGLGSPTGGCIYQSRGPVCSEKPLGLASIGWDLPKGFSIRWDHWSSLSTAKDRGVDMISARWKLSFW